MSIVKRLKLKGFKSFSNPIVIDFENGFNTIVGANGSGKSNVFDAMCFVLGRMSSKGLRADKLGNLVFNGGKSSKAAKEAEVSIFLSNEDKELLDIELDEVKITRVVKNTGQSQYLLNNNKVTRTEIVEVLRRAQIDPDGYNIILQGDIMKIVNMTPNERRQLIEEISNISGYEEKREKGLKKLEKVEIDLKDADLLMEEKTKYLKDLKSEKELAVKYHLVKEDLRFNHLFLVKSKLIRNKNLQIKKNEELEKNELTLKEHKDKLDFFTNKIKEIDLEVEKLEKSIEIESHQDFIEVTNKITQLELEIKNLKEKKAEYTKQSEELRIKNSGIKENISENKKKISNINLNISELEKEKKTIEKNLAEVEKEVSKLKLNINSNAMDEIDQIDKQIDEINEKKDEKVLIKQDNSIQVEKLNGKIEHLEEDLKQIEDNETENKEQLKELNKNRSELKKLIMSISQIANKNSETAAKLNNLQKEYSQLLEESTSLRLKVETSKNLISNNRAVETIINMKKTDPSIHGTVAELATVPEKYSMALETVSGKALLNIVIENDSTAVKYINFLKEKRVGNATFLPLNKIHAKHRLDDSVLNKPGVIDYALNLIQFDKRYENIFHLIFADTLVIEKIEDAKNIGIGSYKMITLEGDLVTKSGSMSGGFRAKRRGLGAFKDDKIAKKLENMDSKVIILKDSIDLLKSEKEDSEREIYDLRQNKIEVESEVAKLEKILSIEGKDTDSIKSEIDAIYSDKLIIENSLKKLKTDIKNFDDEILKLQNKKSKLRKSNVSQKDLFSSIGKVEDKRDEIKEKLREIIRQIDSFNIQLNNVLKPEVDNLNKFLKEGNDALENLKNMNLEVTSSIKSLDEELKENKKKEKELSKDHKEFIEQRDNLRENKKKIEEKYNRQFEKFDKIKEKSAQIRYSISEYDNLNKSLDEELEILYEQLKFDLIEVDENGNKIGDDKISELITQVDEKIQKGNIDVKELQNKVNNLKSKLNSFGSINMKAVEIYDKLSEEFNKLLEKREILNVEKAEVLEFIAEMDEKKKVKFLETFVKLKENFIKTYNLLSTKGEAELNIENEDDLFNSGIEIKVRLSKTNYLDIKSLSGGEKTITAIAFIFAVQEFNPASFYIFDEVDAALDIMNCEKLGKLINQHAHKAQYIVVSHSEYLIQSASSIYGVTMDKNKISGVVSLDLSNMKDYVDSDVSEST